MNLQQTSNGSEPNAAELHRDCHNDTLPNSSARKPRLQTLVATVVAVPRKWQSRKKTSCDTDFMASGAMSERLAT